jgi:diguanylate cyclase (GGDEF)-like protein
MLFFKKLLARSYRQNEMTIDNKRKKRLIHSITIEFLIIGIILECINIYLHLWVLTSLILTGILISILLLVVLKKNYNLLLCGHIINMMSLVMITFANLWIGESIITCVGWFYVPPIVAAATIGLDGLIIYGLLSAILIPVFLFGNFVPIYLLHGDYISFLNYFNHVCIFLLIITLIYNVSSENKQYEALLKDQNYLLSADKQKFHYLSHHDSLTNLPNRAYFNQHLQNIIELTNTTINSLTVFFMDLDGFKKINDEYGHNIGDIVLLQASKRLQSCFRENDFIARMGGDEFTAVIIHNSDDNIANELTKRIEKEFMLPFIINKLEIKCGISIGKANYPLDGEQAEILLKIADDAMYKNKKKKYQINAKNS